VLPRLARPLALREVAADGANTNAGLVCAVPPEEEDGDVRARLREEDEEGRHESSERPEKQARCSSSSDSTPLLCI